MDGVKIASYAGASSNTALNWQSLSFSFTGTGATQDIRIVTEAVSSQSNGRGAMIGKIALQEVLPINTGYQDKPICLNNIVAATGETNGSDVLSVMVGAIPAGSVLSDGTNSFTATSALNTATVTGWNLAALTVTAPHDFTGTFALTVTARCTEIATGDTADASVLLPVTVVPEDVTSPLVIDLSGNGIQTTSLAGSKGTFDLLNTGNPISSGWISPQNGFLAVDANGNGIIDNRSELFGGNIGDGYAKLASFDSNHDGVIDARDARFSELRIWQDANGNHQTDPGELHTLAELGIKSIDLNHTIVPEVQNGNWLLERGKVTFNDGHTAAMADAYFAVGPNTQGGKPATPAQGNGQANSSHTDPAQPHILGIPLGVQSVRDELGAAAAQMIEQQMARQAPAMDSNTDATAPDNASSTDDAKKKRKAKAPQQHDSGWLTDFLGVAQTETSVTDATGLNVTTPTVAEPEQPFVERRQRVTIAPDGTKLTNER